MFISNSVKVVKAKSAKLLWCARVREGEGRDYTKNNSRFSHHNLEAIIKFTIFAISNKNLHHFFDGHSYLRVAFFPTTMKERVTFYVDGFKYTIPEEWDKKRKKLIDSLIQGRNKSVQPVLSI